MNMSRIKYEVYNFIWSWWHMWLRQKFDNISNGERFYLKSRPWWHMCCNGDQGGWRTKFCNHFDEGLHYTKYYRTRGE